MPISVLPTPPDFPPSKPPSKSTTVSSNEPAFKPDAPDSISLLKQQAKTSVLTSAKNASAVALLNAARNQYSIAGTCESEGDLRGALTAFTKAAGLVQMVFDTSEWNGNANNGVKKEVKDFMENNSTNFTSRMQAVEAKLRKLEANESNNDGPVSKPGGSIADRMKALQDSGLSISTSKSKRFSKDLHLTNGNGSPSSSAPSPLSSRTASSTDSPTSAALSTLTGLSAPSTLPGSSSSSTSFTSSSSTSVTSSSTSASADLYSHAFVSPSTLGPPSPGSSPSSSPIIRPALPSGSVNRSFSTSSEYNTFNSQFPSIDELDELDGVASFSLPSVPTGRSTSSNRSIGSGGSGSMRSGKSLRNRDSTSSLKSNKSNSDLKASTPPSASAVNSNNTGSSVNGLASPTPHAALRNFIVPVERPSSTPLRGGTGDSAWDSRPGSPTTSTGKLPTVPIKPSGLSISRNYGNFDDSAPGPSSSPSQNWSSSPPSSTLIPQKNSCTPRELYAYLREHKVILLDARERVEFERGHINAGNKGAMGGVVCVEPAVLRRANVTSDSIEDSLVLAPPSEATTFNNRHKFDLVVLYDQHSISFASGPSTSPSSGVTRGNNADLNSLLRAIWEREFKKTLRRMPMMLIGGYDAWVKEFGEAEVVSSASGSGFSTANGTSTSTLPAADTVMMNGNGPSSSVPPPLISSSISMQGSQARSPFAPGGPLAPSSPGLTSSISSSSMVRPSSPQTTTGRMRAGTSPSRSGGIQGQMGHRSNYSLDQGSGHSRSPAESAPMSQPNSSRSGRATPTQTNAPLSPHFSGSGGGRRPAAIGRASSSLSLSSSAATGPMSTLPEGAASPPFNGSASITYPSFSSPTYSLPSASSSSATIRGSASSSSNSQYPYSHSLEGNEITSPPQASINPSISRRRTSDYLDQSQEALSGMNGTKSPVSAGINAYPGVGTNNYSTGNGYNGGYAGGLVNGLTSMARKPIDYPEISYHSNSNHILRPPPAAASAGVVRLSSPSATGTGTSTSSANSSIPSYPLPGSSSLSSSLTSTYPSAALTAKLGLPSLQPVPRLKNGEWPPRYWPDSPIGTSGLKNMGNTCYMNAPIQCLSATVPFARFFMEADLKNVINYMNKMNSQGQLTRAFSKLLHDIWHGDMPYLTPTDFRRTLCSLNKQYIGTDQHDSQEFLSFLLDGIHEDTNRIMARKPVTRTPEEEERLENLPQQLASEYEWQVWRQSNDSIIVDFFQGQFRNQLRCMSCSKTSTTYNAFSILSLPVPARTGKIPLQNCLKAFFNVEVMEGDDAWDCPRCKTKRRATKTLSLARLPPVLVIHLKRFEANGRFSDKIDTFVDFPVKSLDLTDLMPPPLPPGADQSLLNGGGLNGELDPRIQVGPYRYDLYGVTNHYGNLSSGHYTAFVASRGGWLYCDDSSVKSVDAKQVVNQKAYVLFYKRVKA